MANSNQPAVRRVAIIGAGFSGSLQAINLLRHDGPHATLIERRAGAGRGVAYSAAHPDHLLNVRAGNMSALPDDPTHFTRWLADHHPTLGGFVPRIVYGAYLEGLLADARARAPDRLRLVRGDAVAVDVDGGGARVRLADGRTIDADSVVLAPGNLPPHEPAGLAGAKLPADLYIPDPWKGDIAEGLTDDDTVLVVGTGLTMVDVALLLEARGFRGRIVAMSRRGLMPMAHVDGAMAGATLGERPGLSPAGLVRFMRGRAASVGWRAAVDSLRPHTQGMWLAAASADRARFLRHLRPYWDIHRHRLAPAVAARVGAMRAAGRLTVRAGKLGAFAEIPGGVRATFRARGGERDETFDVRRVVNCSGPQGDLARTGEPLLRAMVAQGLIRPDAQHLGIDTNPRAEVIGVDGKANPRLLAIGPMTRGTFWEIVAVPDIRVQTWSVARKLANAHWVGAEGL